MKSRKKTYEESKNLGWKKREKEMKVDYVKKMSWREIKTMTMTRDHSKTAERVTCALLTFSFLFSFFFN